MSTTIENNLSHGGHPSAEGSTDAQQQSYFSQRMQLLGITEQDNKIGILQNEQGKNVIKEVQVFRQAFKEDKEFGIDILVYSLDRTIINYKPESSRWSKNYCITRLKDPRTNKEGHSQKYHIPKGAGTYPFFHPSLIEKFEKREKIETLFLVEGFFKAWKGCMHGIPVIGLSSITHMKDKDKKELHPDIKRLMLACNVNRMVWLTDGDCLDITSKELKDGVDLFRRPNQFFYSCSTFKTLLDDYDVEKWFFHIDSDNIISNSLFSPAAGEKITRDQVKGLDDLLCTFPDKIDDIRTDILSVSKQTRWFSKHNVTFSIIPVRNYFHLANVNDFYLFHSERRKELKGIQFVFNGTRYKYNEEKNECEIIVPGAAANYFRVGDDYYKFVEIPNKYKQLERAFKGRRKGTIVDDHGKEFPKHIAKYEAFCNVPDHINFQQVINGCFNVYNPIEKQPVDDDCSEEDCATILNFVQHIFRTSSITFTHPKTKEKKEFSTYDLALDYIQILYQRPWEKLPILCLVSKENNTGKSTFGKLLKQIFGSNTAIVGNQDLAGDFNAHWSTKLLVICDETKIDKQVVIEKVKSLSTADKIMMNAKGKDHVEIDCFIKFIFITNNEENFINILEEDIRYWVIKVPTIQEENPDLLDRMIEEIPSFLAYLNRRRLATEKMNRMWFHPTLLRTEALKKVIAQSHSTVKKELKYHLKTIFLDFGVDEIFMSCRVIRENFFRNKEENYIERVLKEELNIQPVQWYFYKDQKFESEEIAISAAKKDDLQELEAMSKITRKGRVMRYTYPKMEMKPQEIGKPPERILVHVSETGRPYKFLRKDFVDGEDAEVSAEIKFANDIVPSINGVHSTTDYNSGPEEQGDLPF